MLILNRVVFVGIIVIRHRAFSGHVSEGGANYQWFPTTSSPFHDNNDSQPTVSSVQGDCEKVWSIQYMGMAECNPQNICFGGWILWSSLWIFVIYLLILCRVMSLALMTSSNGNIFLVTGPCEGNSHKHRWFTLTNWPVTQSFDVFLDLRLNKQLCKHSRCRWFETPSCLLWRWAIGESCCSSAGVVIVRNMDSIDWYRLTVHMVYYHKECINQ